ncbi:MAG: hypothetical protein HeimC3_41380 [Candidatus Heimdallarchaeota archaeon LC_3]|nr:MAG: hypothetical protein HeimC3_41380 [Candidatus Heimdallarchaeota archaeon LC_3]
MNSLDLNKIEQEFIDSGGNLKLTTKEFRKYFNLSSNEGILIFNKLKVSEHFNLKGEYERDQEEPFFRLSIDPFYAWIKNTLNEEEQDIITIIAEKTKVKLSSRYIEVLDKKVIGIDLSALGLEKIGLPEELLQLKYLRYLNLQANGLKKIPELVTKLKNLSHLNISNNGLEKLSDSIKDLRTLQQLNITQNKIFDVSNISDYFSDIEIIQLGDRDYLKELLDKIYIDKEFKARNDDYFNNKSKKIQEYINYLKNYVRGHLIETLLKFDRNYLSMDTERNEQIIIIGILLEADKSISKKWKRDEGFLTLQIIASLADIPLGRLKYRYQRFFKEKMKEEQINPKIVRKEYNRYEDTDSCCKKVANWPIENLKIDTKEIDHLIQYLEKWTENYYLPEEERKKILNFNYKTWEKDYIKNNPFDLPQSLEKLNIMFNSVDWKTALNPFIIQRLCLIMDFSVSAIDIFGEKFIKEFIMDYIDHPSYKYRHLINEEVVNCLLSALMGNYSYNPNTETTEEIMEEIIKDAVDIIADNPTYSINHNDKFSSSLYNLEENQTILKNRIHLINTLSDSYAIAITTIPITHREAQFMYEYYSGIYETITEDFYRFKEKKPANGIYLHFNESNFIKQHMETGTILNDSFIEEQKRLRKQYYN